MSKDTFDAQDTLKQLLLGIFVFGIVFQIAGMFFVESMLKYTAGLWIGIMHEQ